MASCVVHLRDKRWSCELGSEVLGFEWHFALYGFLCCVLGREVLVLYDTLCCRAERRTAKQIDNETDSQTERQTEGQTDRETQADIQLNKGKKQKSNPTDVKQRPKQKYGRTSRMYVTHKN